MEAGREIYDGCLWTAATETSNRSTWCRLRLKCDGTRAETIFRLSTKRTSPFKSARGVSSVDYWQASCAHQPAGFVPLVRACVLQSCDAYWLPTPLPCFLFNSPPVRHRVPSHFNWTLPKTFGYSVGPPIIESQRTPTVIGSWGGEGGTGYLRHCQQLNRFSPDALPVTAGGRTREQLQQNKIRKFIYNVKLQRVQILARIFALIIRHLKLPSTLQVSSCQQQ
jgi:hypothetical protein